MRAIPRPAASRGRQPSTTSPTSSRGHCGARVSACCARAPATTRAWTLRSSARGRRAPRCRRDGRRRVDPHGRTMGRAREHGAAGRVQARAGGLPRRQRRAGAALPGPRRLQSQPRRTGDALLRAGTLRAGVEGAVAAVGQVRAARDSARRLAGPEGIDAALRRQHLDALVAPSTGPSWRTDMVLGDHFTGAGYGAAAVAGYPSITVPMGEAMACRSASYSWAASGPSRG